MTLPRIEINTKGVQNTHIAVDGQQLQGVTRLVYDVTCDEIPTLTVDIGTIAADVVIEQGAIRIGSFEVFNAPEVEFAILEALLRKHAERLSRWVVDHAPLDAGVTVRVVDREVDKVRTALTALVR